MLDGFTEMLEFRLVTYCSICIFQICLLVNSLLCSIWEKVCDKWLEVIFKQGCRVFFAGLSLYIYKNSLKYKTNQVVLILRGKQQSWWYHNAIEKLENGWPQILLFSKHSTFWCRHCNSVFGLGSFSDPAAYQLGKRECWLSSSNLVA